MPDPSPGLALGEGDSLVLVGSHQEVGAAFQSLDGGEAPPVDTPIVPGPDGSSGGSATGR